MIVDWRSATLFAVLTRISFVAKSDVFAIVALSCASNRASEVSWRLLLWICVVSTPTDCLT